MRIRGLRLVALSTVLVLDATMAATTASAQGVPTPTIPIEQADIDNCIADARIQGVPIGAATRGCVPDPERFASCMADARETGDPQADALDRCLDEQRDQPADKENPPTTDGSRSATTSAPSVAVTSPPTAIPEPDDPIRAATDRSDGLGVVPVALIALAAAAVGVLVGLALGRRRRPPHPVTAPTVAPLELDGAGDTDLAQERSLLIQTTIEAADQMTSTAVQGLLTERLRTVGVHPITIAAGTTFDPARHRGVQAEPTTSAEEEGTVARTDREGWSDRGQLLRPPEVIVYRLDDS